MTTESLPEVLAAPDMRRLGPFLLVERVGAGGMGEVWLARPLDVPHAPPLCVVKLVREDLTQQDHADLVQRFLDESRVLLLLQHPRICRVVDAGRAGNVHYLAIDLVRGIDLRQLLQRINRERLSLSAPTALLIARDVLDALAAAHAAEHPLTGAPLGIVHRDISAANIMVSASGDAVLIDFGLALSALKEARTEAGIVLGKMSYMAPEQARGDPIDARSDVFSVGVVLYELLARDRYFGDLDAEATWRRAGRGDHVPPRWARLSAAHQQLLTGLLFSDPERRQTAAQARASLDRALADEDLPALRAELASLVARLASDELARITRAESIADASAPTEADTQRADTLSFAQADSDVVQAAIKRAASITRTEPIVAPGGRRIAPLAAVVLVALVVIGAAIGSSFLRPPSLAGQEPALVVQPAADAAAGRAEPQPAPSPAAPPVAVLEGCTHPCAAALLPRWPSAEAWSALDDAARARAQALVDNCARVCARGVSP